jgi:membrane protein
VRRLRGWETSFPGRCVGTFLDLQGVDRATALAAQAFTALIPLLLLVSALAPADRSDLVSNAIIGKFGLRGDAAHSVEELFTRSGDASIGVLSVVLLVFSGVSLTRRLQRMYLQAWRLHRLPGVRGSVNAAVGLVALLLEIALLSLVRNLVGALPFDWVLGAPLSLLASLALWTSVPWLLLDRRVPFMRLLPAGGLTAVASGLYGIASTVYMPRTMEIYSQRYGLFGVTVALVGWLLCSALILVAATVVAAELDRAPEPWARRLRARWSGGPDGSTAEIAEPDERPVLIPGEGRPAQRAADGHP